MTPEEHRNQFYQERADLKRLAVLPKRPSWVPEKYEDSSLAHDETPLLIARSKGEQPEEERQLAALWNHLTVRPEAMYESRAGQDPSYRPPPHQSQMRVLELIRSGEMLKASVEGRKEDLLKSEGLEHYYS
jgi:hypothetical protein